ncbi:MAG: hypothetical protein AAF662_00590 [Pseudomonadota bacterium]
MTRLMKKERQKKVFDWYLKYENGDHPHSWINSLWFDVVALIGMVIIFAVLTNLAEREILGELELIFLTFILGACGFALKQVQIAASFWPIFKGCVRFEEIRKKREELGA